MAMLPLDDDTAARDPIEKALELGCLLPNPSLDGSEEAI
jgi:hypothetical protein